MEKKLQKITVKGIVQGVWFRKSAKQEAERLGLCGMVKNRADGSVYIEAEGTQEQLDQLAAWCRKGPERAQVDSVTIEAGTLKMFRDFSIHH